MRTDRLPVTSLATCVAFSLIAGCHSHRYDSWASDSQEQAALTTAMRAVTASKFWRGAPTEAEIESVVDTIAHQPSDSIVFLGANRRVHCIGPGSAESYRTAKVQTVRFPEGIDPRFIKIDLLDYPGQSRARILQALPKLLAEQGQGSLEDSGENELLASKYEYTLLFDRDRLRVFGVKLDDIRGALIGYEIVRVEPENSEGILLEVRIGKGEAADPRALMDRVVVTVHEHPVRFRDVGIFRQKLVAEAAPER